MSDIGLSQGKVADGGSLIVNVARKDCGSMQRTPEAIVAKRQEFECALRSEVNVTLGNCRIGVEEATI